MKIGVIGGGQLGRMMALEGYPLGFSFRFYDPSHESPGGQVAERFNSAFEDPQALDRFASGLDLATYEFENSPLSAAQRVASRVSYFFPPIKALQMAQDRLTQKNLFRRLNIGTTPFERVDSLQDLVGAVSHLGFPAVLKTRRMGYDGKGQALLREPKDVEKGWMALGGTPLILEGFIAFERELSLIAVRGRHGRAAFYSMAQNTHHQGILRASIAPAPDLKPEIEAQAQAAAQAIFVELDYVGVLAIEFFLLQGRLIANEMAARVHNSGHWTLDGAAASQFENHLRAGAGLPLGSTAARGVTAMLNFIGELPSPEEVLRIPGAHLHLYGKLLRAGRKLGHANLCAATHAELQPLLAMASRLAGIRL